LREILAKPETSVEEIARAWWPHTMIEEEILYPTLIAPIKRLSTKASCSVTSSMR